MRGDCPVSFSGRKLSHALRNLRRRENPTVPGEGLDILTHMLSVVLASCRATVSCGNFHSHLTVVAELVGLGEA